MATVTTTAMIASTATATLIDTAVRRDGRAVATSENLPDCAVNAARAGVKHPVCGVDDTRLVVREYFGVIH
ncbi:hypothetical protein GCM10011399_13450 [Subtercola lobariae]|uniref:Uncharacterized protein n=1 Tax=Subtercola lobariae TaxID=1588641 RepID=A0A917EXJ9_9MICO|nr:hypothetical protein GCM10011399_13450 [Subtercola lobariae]